MLCKPHHGRRLASEVILSLALATTTLVAAQPGPNAKPSRPRLNSTLNHSTVPAARAAWQKDAGNIRELLDELKVLEGKYGRVKADLAKARPQLAELQKQREVELDEMRKGRFCHSCKRSASKVERETGERFETHAAKNGGIIRATPAELKALADKFDAQIEPLKQRINRWAEEEHDIAWQGQLLDGDISIVVWWFHRNVADEAKLRVGGWQKEKTRMEDALVELNASAAKAREVVKQAQDEAQSTTLRADLDLLETKIRTETKRLHAEYQTELRAASEFVKLAKDRIEGLKALAGTLKGNLPLVAPNILQARIDTFVLCPIGPPKEGVTEATARDLRSLLDGGTGNPARAQEAPKQTLREILESK